MFVSMNKLSNQLP